MRRYLPIATLIVLVAGLSMAQERKDTPQTVPPISAPTANKIVSSKVEHPCGPPEKGRLCANSCTGTQAARMSFCDGKGACKQTIAYPCSPYTCRDGTCLVSCSSDQDCATSHVCRGGQCLLRPAYCSDDPNTGAPGPGRYVVTSDRGFINCYPYKCRETFCLQTCGSTVDCYTGFKCSADGTCVP